VLQPVSSSWKQDNPSIPIAAPSMALSKRGEYGSQARLAYIPELDGLRAIAIGAVLLDHTMPRFFPGGFIGVDIFFVLSGYLITSILYRQFELEGRIHLRNFYVRRALRLMPALLAMLTVYMAVLLAFKDTFFADQSVREHELAILSSALYIMDWTQVFNVGTGGYLVHTWSLGVEEQFYILWPLTLIAILRYTDRASVWKPVVFLIVVVTGWRVAMVFDGASPMHVYNGFDTRIDTLFIGCLLALAPLGWLRSSATRLYLCPVLILAVISMTAVWTSRALYLVGFPAIALCAAWLIVAAVAGEPNGLLRRFLRWGPLNYWGRISYGFYLWHYPIARMFESRFSHVPFGEVKTLVATAICALLIATASYWILERPILRLGRRFR
jgi:peptidoglycan/LPS O-acetylase OafA/YrhL